MFATVDPLSESRSAVRLIRAEFNEMPGMRLTLRQASRLWRLPEERCASLLETLVIEGFLVFDRQTGYRRPAAIRSRPR